MTERIVNVRLSVLWTISERSRTEEKIRDLKAKLSRAEDYLTHLTESTNENNKWLEGKGEGYKPMRQVND